MAGAIGAGIGPVIGGGVGDGAVAATARPVTGRTGPVGPILVRLSSGTTRIIANRRMAPVGDLGFRGLRRVVAVTPASRAGTRGASPSTCAGRSRCGYF